MIEKKNIGIFEDTIMYFNDSFDEIDMSLISILIETNNQFQILYAYSIDGTNYSNYQSKEFFTEIIHSEFPLYLSIYFKRIIEKDLRIPDTLYQNENVDHTFSRIVINGVIYDGKEYDLIKDFRFKTFYSIINEFPKWNFYDGQQVTIDRWLKQCNAIVEMYGHTAIYFKTEPDSGKTVHTLSNNVIRNVVDIKKLHIMFPNNELPQDRNIYTDWDMPLQDEIFIHIAWDKFKQAFGENAIPNEKDYLYLPLINKYFRISTVQPKNGFMGKIGWWEAYLSKYEEDETVKIPKSLSEAYSGIPEFDSALDELNWYDDEDNFDTIINEKDIFIDDTIRDTNKINIDTIEEKKSTTQNFTNKFIDSTFKVSLKETEKLREFYDKRLSIVSINPDSNSFPITMYNCQLVENRVVAMQYDLKDYTSKNKFNTIFQTNYKLNFNFILDKRFTGEIFDIIANTNVILLTIENKYNKISLIDSIRQQTFDIDFTFNIHDFYNIDIEYQNAQYIIKIFRLENGEKTLDYQNIYIVDILDFSNFDINKIFLFGGKHYINDIIFHINDNKILTDNCNPLLQMNNFG